MTKTHKKPAHFRTMDIDVENIYKNDKNTWRTTHEAIDEPYLKGLTYLLKHFLVTVKIIQTIHKKIHLKSRRGLKPSP